MRVLVVDNDCDTANSVAMLLKYANCEVRVAYDAPSALDEATKFLPDLLLADLGMPRMDGTDLARAVRESKRLEKTVLVAMTGYADQQHRELAIAAGFTEYLVKPVPIQTIYELLARIAERLDGSRARIAKSIHQADVGNAMAKRSIRPLWERDGG